MLLATITVNNFNDGTLSALAGDGRVSLREAIQAANTNSSVDGSVAGSGADTINFASVPAATTILLAAGELQITESLTITGLGQSSLMIDAGAGSRLIKFTSQNGNLSISGLTLKNGLVGADNQTGAGIQFLSGGTLTLTASTLSGNATTGEFGHGGGIFTNAGAVTLVGSVVSGNSTSGYGSAGGGIYTNSGNVTLTDSTVSNNSTNFVDAEYPAFAAGGGIYTQSGNVTLTGSTISGNKTIGDESRGGGISTNSGTVTVTASSVTGNSTEGTYSYGGGISSMSGGVTVTGSTVSGNRSTGYSSPGGGIFSGSGPVSLNSSTLLSNETQNEFSSGGGVYSDTGTVTLTRSTVSGNRAIGSGSQGGGISSGGVLLVDQSTVVSNVADTSVGGNNPSGEGGGIFVFNDPATIVSSIVTGNSAKGGAQDLRLAPGETRSLRFSLIGNNNATLLSPAPVGSPDANGNLIGTNASPIDPLLLALANNGGPTMTHNLQATSPALNAGDPTITTGFDQRGTPYVRLIGTRADMGALELFAADFGDAPATYPVTLANNGARHNAIGPRLGAMRDTEVDAAVSANALGDDTTGVDDEDGVLFGRIAVDAAMAALNVDLQNAQAAKIDAWIDFNRNGSWDDPGEKILDSVSVVAGLQTINFAVGPGATAGATFARVRVSTAGGLSPRGMATDGEVEDYAINITNAAAVVDRRIFYNRSFFDGTTTTVPDGPNDATAIDTSKTALRPGGTATSANYTSYSRGINGIFIDVQNLQGSVTLADFEFRVGNSNLPSSWPLLGQPATVQVFPGQGLNGSDRIRVTWADNVIQKQWLQVTLKATAATGLAMPDVHYWGNAIGETGNSSANAIVNLSDVATVREGQTGFGFAAIGNVLDLNKDRRVNLSDVALARQNQSGFNPLRLIVPTV